MTERTVSDPPVVVLVTAPDTAAAERLAEALTEARLAACVTYFPGARSRYRWKGVLASADEVLLLVKTRESRVPDILDRLPAIHPYEVPEILVLPVVGGYPPYLEWIRSETDAGES